MQIASELLAEGQSLPRWYGLAYWRWDADIAVFYPVPLNFIVGQIRKLYYWLVRPSISIYEKRWRGYLLEVRRSSYEAGEKVGYSRGHKDGQDGIKQQLLDMYEDYKRG